MLYAGASNTLVGPFHVAFCGGWALVEIARDSLGCEIGASVEETASDCFEECRSFGAAHQLMRKFDAVGLGSDGVCEETKFVWWWVWQRLCCCFLRCVGLGTSTQGDC